MSRFNLQDDLLQEFKAERKMINEQVLLLDPLATSLRKPAAQRMLSTGALVLFELLCYVLTLGTIAFMIFMNKIYPFYIMSDVLYNSKYRDEIGILNITYLNLAIYGLAGLSALLFFIIARMARRIRLKNEIINMAGKDIKVIVGEHLNRKAAISAIEQRHFIELPGFNDMGGSIVTNINDVPNPGYDEEP